MKNIITAHTELLRLPLEQLQPKPNILNQLFRIGQKNEAHAPDEFFPQGDALYRLFPKLWRSVPLFYAEYIANCTEQWIATGLPAQVVRWQSQTPNEQGADVLHFFPDQSVWKISFRWWLQGNEVVLVVFFEAPHSVLDAFLSEIPAVARAVLVPSVQGD